MKSRSLAKWALLMAIRSMMGVTWSPKDSGCSSLSHSVALNLSSQPEKVGQGPWCLTLSGRRPVVLPFSLSGSYGPLPQELSTGSEA